MLLYFAVQATKSSATITILDPKQRNWAGQIDVTAREWIANNGDGLFSYDKDMSIYFWLDEANHRFVGYACVKPNTDTANPDLAQFMHILKGHLIVETIHLKSQKNRVTVYQKCTKKKA